MQPRHRETTSSIIPSRKFQEYIKIYHILHLRKMDSQHASLPTHLRTQTTLYCTNHHAEAANLKYIYTRQECKRAQRQCNKTAKQRDTGPYYILGTGFQQAVELERRGKEAPGARCLYGWCQDWAWLFGAVKACWRDNGNNETEYEKKDEVNEIGQSWVRNCKGRVTDDEACESGLQIEKDVLRTKLSKLIYKLKGGL